MDRSREYLEMCRSSKYIQDEWTPEEGDYVYVSNNLEIIGYIPEKNRDAVYTMRNLRYGDKPYNRRSHSMIWVPAQDQLWDLIGNGKKLFPDYGILIDSEKKAFEFVFFSPSGSALHMVYGSTQEQCLLQAYIQLNYRFKWDGVYWTQREGGK